jgi:primosomal protein N' (replication factor Y) (superfamily II helicase)
VDVCVAVPRLAVDRPFTYVLNEEEGAGTGSLVTVPFHRRSVKGWVLGPAAEVPTGRLLPVRKVHSPVRFFDERMLRLLRWMSERYIAPLATVIERSYPPRVVSEEVIEGVGAAVDAATPAPSRYATRSRGAPGGYAPPLQASHPPPPTDVLARYGGQELLRPGTTTWLRPLPEDEQAVCLRVAGACLAAGTRAIVLVPEAEPVPETARTVLEAFGDRAVAFLGGDARERYRTWLRIKEGKFDVVVGTRPAVFAHVGDLGLIWISREVHPGHREERSPYYHVREVAMARARLEGAACVLASFAPSVDSVVSAEAGTVIVARPHRSLEKAAAPLVETVTPQAEDRSPRLTALLKRARSAALIVSRRGYGVARVCRSCGEPAACATCRGPLVVQRGKTVCRVCGSEGVCANCGGRSFGVERGGTERVAEWASRTTPTPVALADGGEDQPALPRPEAVIVGTAAAVKDMGPLRLDLVAILDADRALARAGIHAGEQALATWMEAAAWARPRAEGGKVVVHSRRPAHPAIQALVRWEPVPFLLAQARSRGEAGFAPGQAIFRVTGDDDLEEALRGAGATTVLTTAAEGGTLCLVAVPLKDLSPFRREIVRLASSGNVTRVEAEPQL